MATARRSASVLAPDAGRPLGASLRLVAGPLRRCDVDLQTAATGAGTLATVDVPGAGRRPGWLTPAARRPVLAAAQTLLGIATLIAREPMVVVAAAIVRDGRVLAATAAAVSGAGSWELPGGKVEPGETDAVALRREIAEELSTTGFGAEPDRARTSTSATTASCGAIAQTPTAGRRASLEHDELRWLAPEELRSGAVVARGSRPASALESCLRRS